MAEATAGAQGGLERDFGLEIVTPERQLVSETVEALRAPGIAGEFGVLPSHVRLITGPGTGMVRYRVVGDDFWTELAVSSGLVEVLPGRVIILAQTAETARDVDVARAETALERAKERLEHPDDETDVDRALEALQRATVRLQAFREGGSEDESRPGQAPDGSGDGLPAPFHP